MGRGGAFLGDQRAERAGNLISEHINSGTLFAFTLWIEFLAVFRRRVRGTIGTGVAGVDAGALKPPHAAACVTTVHASRQIALCASRPCF